MLRDLTNLHARHFPPRQPLTTRLALEANTIDTVFELSSDDMATISESVTGMYDVGNYRDIERICNLVAQAFLRSATSREMWRVTNAFLTVYHHVLAIRGSFQGQFSAIAIAKAHRQAAVLVGDLPAAVRSTSSLGAIHIMLGDQITGERWLEWADARRGVVADQAALYDCLAAADQARGEIGRAIRHTLLAIELADGDPLRYGYMIGRLAELELSQPSPNLDRAMNYATEAVSISGLGLSRANSLTACIKVALYADERALARQFYREALKTCRGNGLRAPALNVATLAIDHGLLLDG